MKTKDGPSYIRYFRILMMVIVLFIMTICVYYYHNYRVFNSIKVITKDTAVVEYGSANYDIKELIKEVDGDIVSVKKDIDTNIVGEQEVILEVKKDNIIKEVPITVSVVDTTAPVIELSSESMKITEGDELKLESNVASVKDDVDGDFSYLADVNEDSENYYTIGYSDDINTVGDHEITVTAVDKYGNTTVSTFTLTVEAKPVVETKPIYNVYNAPINEASGDIASLAYSYVGYAYASGANGPYAFDCSGFVQYIYSRFGKYISRSTSTQLYDGTGISYENIQPGDIIVWGYSNGVATHSALYVGNGMMVHAANPSQGVIASNVSSWLNGSGTVILSVRRIN